MADGQSGNDGEERSGPSGGGPDAPAPVKPRERASTTVLDDGASLATSDEDPLTQPRRRGWTTVVMNPEPDDDDDDGHEALDDSPEGGVEPTADEEPPAAVRPLGRLGTDGWGLALDYAPATGEEEQQLENWLSEAIPEVEPMAATEAHPELSFALHGSAVGPPQGEGAADYGIEGTAPTVGMADLQRLTSIEDGGPTEQSARLEAWLERQHEVEIEAPPPTTAPETAPPETAPPATQPPYVAAVDLPFAAVETSATRTLEGWVDAWLQAPSPAVAPAPPAPAAPADRPPPIIPRVPGPATPDVDRPVDDAPESDEPSEWPPLVPMQVYAELKIRLWDDGTPLVSALEEAGIEETTWREHELRQATALAEELREGKATLATALRRAIAEARTARADEAWGHLLPLATYAAIAVELEPLEHELERREALLRHDLTVDAWDEQRAGWAKRARLERGLNKRMRRALAKARRDRPEHNGADP